MLLNACIVPYCLHVLKPVDVNRISYYNNIEACDKWNRCIRFPRCVQRQQVSEYERCTVQMYIPHTQNTCLILGFQTANLGFYGFQVFGFQVLGFWVFGFQVLTFNFWVSGFKDSGFVGFLVLWF